VYAAEGAWERRGFEQERLQGLQVAARKPKSDQSKSEGRGEEKQKLGNRISKSGVLIFWAG
jgi:hypothetical protein